MTRNIFLILAMLTTSIWAQDDVGTKAIMNKVYNSFMSMMPYLYSGKEIDKKNSGVVITHLMNLETAFKEAKHSDFLNTPGFKSNLDSVTTHLQETIDVLNGNNFLMAKPRLEALATLCMNCHGQLSSNTAMNSFGDSLHKVGKDFFASDLEYANYLFLIRRYDEAQSFYEKYLGDLLKQKNVGEGALKKMRESLRKILAINIKIQFDPKRAEKILLSYRQSSNIPTMLKKDLDSWIAGIKKIKSVNLKSYTKENVFITKFLNPLEKEEIYTGKEDVTLLMGSGYLTKYMNDKVDESERAEILYWLAVSERRLNNSYFYSLSDLYLKECITKFSKSSYAEKCFNEYQDALNFGYTGSLGTEIPDSEKKELERLKTFLKK